VPTFDVVLHTNGGMFRENAQELLASFPSVKDRFELGRGLWLGRLDSDLANALMDTCEPKVLGIPAAVRQYAQMYAYGRDLSPDAEIHRWDDDHRLSRLVAMSRLIHPTTVGFRYAARVRHSDQILTIVPAELYGISPDVYLSPSHTRDWLTVPEAELLAGVDAESEHLTQPSFPKRVSRALWYFDYAQRTYYADLRWTMIATALEALIHTGTANSTRHFKFRVPALAAEVGAPAMTASESDAAYDHRSRLSHGDAFLYDIPQADINVYDKLEETLRLTILKAFREPSFAAVFLEDSRIEARWPA
jgi:hypothetical protein